VTDSYPRLAARTARFTLGIPRSLYCYVQSSRLEVKIAGTEQRLYALDSSNEVTDITPYRATVAADTPGMFISTAAGSQTVTITDPAHGAQVGDRIFITPDVVVGGLTIGGEYAVFTVVDVDHYTIVDNQAAAGDATLAFVSTIGYYITNGNINPQEGVGYGTGPYGAFHYGVARSPVGTAKIKPPRHWSLDNYGTNGLFAYQGSQVYMWNENTMDRPEVMPGSPFDTIYAFVTPERFIFVLCEGMRLVWPDRDNPYDWIPTLENTANIRTLGTGSHLVAGCRLSGVSLIFSDTSVYSAHYIGGNSIYATDLLGTNCGLVGPGAFAHETGTCYWFGCSSFHMYSGQISPIPNQDNVLAWILEHADSANRVKTTCWFNPPFREVWWTFASHNSPEPDLYVAVNLENFEWIHGTLARVGGAQQSQRSRLPILSSKDGWLYEHDQENNRNADGAPLNWHYQVGLWRIPSDKKQSVDIFGFAPDFEQQIGEIALEVQARDRPQSLSYDRETATLALNTELTDLRVAGRFFSYRLSQSEILDGDFRDGTHWLQVEGAGLRR